MAYVSIYLPKALETRLRLEARRQGKSFAAFVAEVIAGRVERKGWPKGFFRSVVGGWKGDFPAVARPQPEHRPSL